MNSSEAINLEDRVAITGMALTTAKGTDLSQNIASWWEGHHHFSEIEDFCTSGSSVRYAAQCPKPDLRCLPDRKVTKILTKKDVIGLMTSLNAAKAAQFQPGTIPPERIGMYVGAGSTQIKDLTPYFPLVASCVRDGQFNSEQFGARMHELVNPMVVLQTLMNNTLCFTSIALDIRGVNSNFMDFQTAGLRAIGEAFRTIRDGRADMVIAGGVASPVEPFSISAGLKSQYIARTHATELPPQEIVRPYDRSRMGTILAEGAGFVVLERYSNAKKRGAPIFGFIDGYGISSDGGAYGTGSGVSAPGLCRAVDRACEDAQSPLESISFISGQGRGAKDEDLAELRACDYLLKQRGLLSMPLVSPFGLVGDLSEASGVLSLVLAADSLEKKKIPPTWNHLEKEQDSENLSRLLISPRPQELTDKCKSLVISRSFLGISCALVLSR